MSEVLKATVPFFDSSPGDGAKSPGVPVDGGAFVRFLLSMPKCGLPDGLPVIPRQNWRTPIKFDAISKDMGEPLFNPWPPSEESE